MRNGLSRVCADVTISGSGLTLGASREASGGVPSLGFRLIGQLVEWAARCDRVQGFNGTNGATITPTAGVGQLILVTCAAAAAAFTINPVGSPVGGQSLRYRILNVSGGALGALTFGAGLSTSGAWTQPATGFQRDILFRFDSVSAKWLEQYRSPADVAS